MGIPVFSAMALRLSPSIHRVSICASVSLKSLRLRLRLRRSLLAVFAAERDSSALIALEKSAVDFGRNRLFVVNPKWKRDRRKTEGVPMSREAEGLVRRLCAAARGSRLFTDEHGRGLKRATVDHFFRKACKRAGVGGFRFHDLRHEYGSRLGDADVNLKKIARLMGHSTTKQTERYVHPTDDGLLAATERAAQRGRATIVPGRLRGVG